MKHSSLPRAGLPLAAILAIVLACALPRDAASAAATAAATATASPDTTAVSAAYQNWLKTVSTAHGNPAPMLQFYAPDAILVATYSPDLLHNDKGELSGYFARFTGLPGISGTTQDLQTRVFGDWAINTGLYTFSFQDLEGDTVSVPARFTFVYRKVGDQWLIVDHHSSIVPAPL